MSKKGKQTLPLAILALGVYLLTWEASCLVVQDVMTRYLKPYVMNYLQMSANIVFFPALFLHPQTRTDFRDAFVCASMNLLSNFCYFIALHGTIAVVSNSLCQLNLVFIYGLSIAFLSKKVTFLKNAAILSCVVGTILIVTLASQSEDGQRNEWWGILAIMVANVCWSVYVVYFAYARENSSSATETLAFVSLQGLATLLLLWIPIPILHFTGVETLSLPHKSLLGAIVGNTFAKPVISASGLMVVAFASPLFYQISCVMIIPVGIIAEYFVIGLRLKPIFFLGLAMIFLGWGLDLYGEVKEGKEGESEEEMNEEKLCSTAV